MAREAWTGQVSCTGKEAEIFLSGTESKGPTDERQRGSSVPTLTPAVTTAVQGGSILTGLPFSPILRAAPEPSLREPERTLPPHQALLQRGAGVLHTLPPGRCQ